MRRMILLTVAALLAVTSYAQPRPRPEELSAEDLVTVQSRDMSYWLGLYGEQEQKFREIYAQFRREINSLAQSVMKSDHDDTDEEVERSIKANFEVSRKMLDIRESYYPKFRSVISPRLIRRMYQIETERGRGAMQHKRGPEPPGQPDWQNPNNETGNDLFY